MIGADGLRSRVARWVGSRSAHVGRHATAILYGYYAGLPDEGQHLYFGNRVAAGSIPTNGDRTCVFVAVPPERLGAYLRQLRRLLDRYGLRRGKDR